MSGYNSGYEGGGFQENQSSNNQGSGYQNQGGNYQGRDNNSNPYPRNNSYGGGNNNYRGGGGGGNYRGGGGGGGYKGGGGGWKKDRPPRDFDKDPPKFYRPYAVFGNVQIPSEVSQVLQEVGQVLDRNEFTARVGGMDGPQKSFMDLPGKELVLPFRGYGNLESKLSYPSEESKFLAKKFDPNFDNRQGGAQSFKSYNVRLLCGQNLMAPAQFAVVWSEDGCEDGSQANQQTGYLEHFLKVAETMRIPAFNFQRQDAKDRLYRHLRINP